MKKISLALFFMSVVTASVKAEDKVYLVNKTGNTIEINVNYGPEAAEFDLEPNAFEVIAKNPGQVPSFLVATVNGKRHNLLASVQHAFRTFRTMLMANRTAILSINKDGSVTESVTQSE